MKVQDLGGGRKLKIRDEADLSPREREARRTREYLRTDPLLRRLFLGSDEEREARHAAANARTHAQNLAARLERARGEAAMARVDVPAARNAIAQAEALLNHNREALAGLERKIGELEAEAAELERQIPEAEHAAEELEAAASAVRAEEREAIAEARRLEAERERAEAAEREREWERNAPARARESAETQREREQAEAAHRSRLEGLRQKGRDFIARLRGGDPQPPPTPEAVASVPAELVSTEPTSSTGGELPEPFDSRDARARREDAVNERRRMSGRASRSLP